MNAPQMFQVAIALLTIVSDTYSADQAVAQNNSAPPILNEDLLNDHVKTSSVLLPGMGYNRQSYSPLTQINTTTINNLSPAWLASFDSDNEGGTETQPLFYDGILYTTSSHSRIYAHDGRTGKLLWSYIPELQPTFFCCGPNNRGAAIYQDNVYIGQLDNEVVALNRYTGEVEWSTNILEGDEYASNYAITGAPLIVDGILIIGAGGGESFVTGTLWGLDTTDGRIIWKRPVIEGKEGHGPNGSSTTGSKGASWDTNSPAWIHGGGGATWGFGSYDPEENLVYWGTGNPVFWNPWSRSENAKTYDDIAQNDNLYTASTVALNPQTGEVLHHFQHTPNDAWDYDAVNAMVLFEGTVDGKEVPLGAIAGRNGYFYLLDRSDLSFIKGFPYIPINWSQGLDKSGRPIINMEALPPNPYLPENQSENDREGTFGGYVNPDKFVKVFPTLLGGKNWQPMAYNPQTGLFYFTGIEASMMYAFEYDSIEPTDEEAKEKPITVRSNWEKFKSLAEGKKQYFIDAEVDLTQQDEDGYFGFVMAVDPLKEQIVWKHQKRNGQMYPMMTTAGNLAFAGDQGLHRDFSGITAYNATTGEQVWSFPITNGVASTPITYELDEKQYLAVPFGCATLMGVITGITEEDLCKDRTGSGLVVFSLREGN